MNIKLRIVSDLHTELNSTVGRPFVIPVMPDDKETILVLAGDICVMHGNNLEIVKPFFADVCSRFKKVLYVFGNHEFYKTSMVMAMLTFMDQIGKHYPNLTVTTDGATVMEGDCKFIMATLWTGWDHPQEVLALSNEHSMHHCRKNMGDFFLITDEDGKLLTPEKTKEIHLKHLAFIRHELEAADYKKSVVITHHCPSLKSIAPRFHRDPMNPAFSSNLSDFMAEYKPALWIHGHTHVTFHYMDHDTQVICNPKGYGGENPNYYPYLTVDLTDEP